jgi:hypothetical protein
MILKNLLTVFVLTMHKAKGREFLLRVIHSSAVSSDERIKEQSRREAIPEFLRFNIVESEVQNVI